MPSEVPKPKNETKQDSHLEPANRIDELADLFERKLVRDEHTSVENFISEVAGEERRNLLRELLLRDIHYARKRGRTVNPDQYRSRFPEYHELIKEVWDIALQEDVQKSGDDDLADTQIYQGDTHSHANSMAPSGDTEVSLPSDFGRYRIIKRIGAGGMGSVFLAHDTKLDRSVALKIPRVDVAQNQEIRERFEREARHAAALSHPNICPVHDVGEELGYFYISMAYVSGESLADVLILRGSLTPDESVDLVRKLALALAEAHDNGVVHRDLKPSNIMIDQRGEPVIMDFGLAVRLNSADPRLTASGTLVGTPLYMSPEQVNGDPQAIGPATDIYSLGVILYQLLTGRVPFAGSPSEIIAAILRDKPTTPRKFVPDLDRELTEICSQAMDKDPAERFSTMNDFAHALEAYHARQSTAGHPPIHRRWAVLGGFAAAIFLGVILFLFRTQYGTVKVELSDPDADVQVLVDGDRIDVMGLERPLQFRVGPHKLTVIGADYETITQDFKITKGDNPVLRVRLFPALPNKPASLEKPLDSNKERIDANRTKRASVDPDFVAQVSRLSGTYQLNAVSKKLKELNPGFDGDLQHRIEDGKLIGLTFQSTRITDISPLAALKDLKTLDFHAETVPCADSGPRTPWAYTRGIGWHYRGLISDLTPLADLKLQRLHCAGTCVSDFTPLAKLPLIDLSCDVPLYDSDVRALLESFTSLESLNGKPVDQFWRDQDAQHKAIDELTKSVELVSVEAQVELVEKMLQKLNPGFADTLIPKINKNGIVTGLTIRSKMLIDISPLRSLAGLEDLDIDSGVTEGLGILWDLSPLRGMHLKSLRTNQSEFDLSPLAGMPLERLFVYHCPLANLQPIGGMKLRSLNIRSTLVSHLSALKDMPLQDLDVSHNDVNDLSPLRGMPLKSLSISVTQVADLSPLKGMPLEELVCSQIYTSDYTPLEGLPLKRIDADIMLYREDHERILRGIKSLEDIRTGRYPQEQAWVYLSPDEFWQLFESRRDRVEQLSNRIRKLPAEEQLEEVLQELENLDPNHRKSRDAYTAHTLSEGEIIELMVEGWDDFSPLRALPKLQRLKLTSHSKDFYDLSAIGSLPLIDLDYKDAFYRSSRRVLEANAKTLRAIESLKTVNGQHPGKLQAAR